MFCSPKAVINREVGEHYIENEFLVKEFLILFAVKAFVVKQEIERHRE